MKIFGGFIGKTISWTWGECDESRKIEVVFQSKGDMLNSQLWKKAFIMLLFASAIVVVYGENQKGITIVSCPFGSGPGEAGVSHNDMLFGPCDFAIDDENNVYICDYYNSRILKFSSQGKLLKTIQEKDFSPLQLAISPNHDLYVCGRKLKKSDEWTSGYYGLYYLYIYDKDYNLIRQVSQDEITMNGFLYIDYKGNVYFVAGNRTYAFNSELKPVPALTFEKAIEPLVCYHWSGLGVLILNKQAIVIKNIFTGEELFAYIPQKPVISCKVVGTDKDGNIYVHYYPEVPPRTLRDRIIKFAPNGTPLGEIELFRIARGDIGFVMFIAPNGDVYTANIDGRKDRYWIDRYPNEWFYPSRTGGEK